jgi:hypothetical protein
VSLIKPPHRKDESIWGELPSFGLLDNLAYIMIDNDLQDNSDRTPERLAG